MKRKMVSFILCIAMCMALAIPAFAVELSPYATDEVGNFSQMIEFAFSDNVEGRFRYSYNDAAGNVVDGNAVQNRFTAYLITAIRRKKTDYWKKTEHVRTHELIVDTDEVFEDGETSYENVMNIGGEIQNEALEDALKRLSIRERYIIFARVVDMRGFAEIGTELGLGYQGVAAVYYRAIRKIKEFIVKSEKEGKASK